MSSSFISYRSSSRHKHDEDKYKDKDSTVENHFKNENHLIFDNIIKDVNESKDLNKEDPINEYRELREKVNFYVKIFNEHISNPQHPIHFILRNFAELYSSHIIETLEEIESMRITITDTFINLTEKKLHYIVSEIQKFIIKVQTTLKLFYSRFIDLECFVEEKDEVINLISTHLFNYDKLYLSLYQLEKVLIVQDFPRYEQNFRKFKDIKPEAFEITDKFCLNEVTERLMQKLNEMKIKENKLKENKQIVTNFNKDKVN